MTSWVRHRIAGVDAARGVALLGMMAVHVIPPLRADGSVSPAFTVAAGRSAALFAVLAGVGLVLLTRWDSTTSARRRARDRVAIVVRAALLIGVGLLLGEVDAGVAVILAYYGVMFAFAVPFLGMSARSLGALAAVTATLVPVGSHLLRPALPAPTYAVPTLEVVGGSWAATLSELTLTGYYPALPWMAYLFAGMAVGRLPLAERAVAWRLLVGGLVLGVTARAVSWLLLSGLGGADTLRSQTPELFGRPLDRALDIGLFGTTPAESWWWLAVAAPHSSTTLDLATTIGAALGVLGLLLLVVPRPRWWAMPLLALGGMSLTVYSLHVLLLGSLLPRTLPHAYLAHVVVLTAFALLWRFLVGQGPLEYLTAQVAGRVSRSVVRPDSPPVPTAPPS